MTKTDKSGADELYTLHLKPKVNPKISCPQSVLHLPAVIEGIKNGEIEVCISKQN